MNIKHLIRSCYFCNLKLALEVELLEVELLEEFHESDKTFRCYPLYLTFVLTVI